MVLVIQLVVVEMANNTQKIIVAPVPPIKDDEELDAFGSAKKDIVQTRNPLCFGVSECALLCVYHNGTRIDRPHHHHQKFLRTC
jgi:hypothetical protein